VPHCAIEVLSTSFKIAVKTELFSTALVPWHLQLGTTDSYCDPQRGADK